MVTIIECNQNLVPPTTLLTESPAKVAIEKLLRTPVESYSRHTGSAIAADYHAFIFALHAAFVDHRPFVLSPDMIWLLIAQGFAAHVNKHAEEMRGHFVSHEGKKNLEVIRDEFIKGSPENPWENVFDEFSSHIRTEIGRTNHDQIVAEFSTTGPIERAANEVVLMNSMKAYFEYVVTTRCGIPEIHLEGNSEDWGRLATKVRNLGDAYGIQWWTNWMLPILEAIAAQADGRGNPDFWRDIYKWNQASGGPFINGWIMIFVPYLTTATTQDGLRRNWLLNCDIDFLDKGVSTYQLPSGVSMAPFVWNYFDTRYEMEFVAGFTCSSQDPESFAVRPNIGWAVRDKPRSI